MWNLGLNGAFFTLRYMISFEENVFLKIFDHKLEWRKQDTLGAARREQNSNANVNFVGRQNSFGEATHDNSNNIK